MGDGGARHQPAKSSYLGHGHKCRPQPPEARVKPPLPSRSTGQAVAGRPSPLDLAAGHGLARSSRRQSKQAAASPASRMDAMV